MKDDLISYEGNLLSIFFMLNKFFAISSASFADLSPLQIFVTSNASIFFASLISLPFNLDNFFISFKLIFVNNFKKLSTFSSETFLQNW